MQTIFDLVKIFQGFLVAIIIIKILIYLIIQYNIKKLSKKNCKCKKELKEKQEKESKNFIKFLAIVPGRNEEKVIKKIITDLKNQNYPKDKYEICIIADNCTDNTAKIAKSLGVNVFERFDETKKTKGYALDWFIQNHISNFEYDAVAIFDADNHIDSEFLKVMNKRVQNGDKFIQGNREIKNPDDNWISAGSAIFYWGEVLNDKMQKEPNCLTTRINGTGFVVVKELIKDGWKTTTLVEDVEFSLMKIFEGYKIRFEEKAIVYDEQPIEFYQSIKQRERWTIGQFECYQKLFITSIKKVISNPKSIEMWMQFDLLFNFLMLRAITILVITHTGLIISDIIFEGTYEVYDVYFGIKSLILSFIIFVLISLNQAYFTIKNKKKDLKKYMKYILLNPIFYITWAIVYVKILIKPDKNWVQIKRKDDIKNL